MKAAIYEINSGRITSIFSGPTDHIHLQPLEGESFIILGPLDEVGDTTHYVKLPEEEALPKTPLTYTLDTTGLTATITGLPAEMKVFYQGQHIVTDDDPTEIEFELPGTYQLEMTGSVPHLDETLEVTVNG